jgi:hypothetical protein
VRSCCLCGEQDGLVDRGMRRRVRQVQPGQVVHVQAGVQGDRDHVDLLGHPTPPTARPSNRPTAGCASAATITASTAVERPPIAADNPDVVERTSANAMRSRRSMPSANLVGHRVNQRRADGAGNPIGQLDQHDVNAPVDRGRRHLQPEIVGADYQRPADQPGVEQAAPTDRVL